MLYAYQSQGCTALLPTKAHCSSSSQISANDGVDTDFQRSGGISDTFKPGTEVIICAELDEQCGWVGAKSQPRGLFYAYDKLRKSVIAHVFGERNLETLERLLALLSEFDIVVWMTDGWPTYAKRLKREIHINSKRFTQRIERHDLNLRQHIAWLGRKTLT